MMTRWIARLAFSFILLAAVFAWEGNRIRRGDRDSGTGASGSEGKMYACFVAAAVCFGLGLRGVQERHRPRAASRRDDDPTAP